MKSVKMLIFATNDLLCRLS